jgi:hypothetical protein
MNRPALVIKDGRLTPMNRAQRRNRQRDGSGTGRRNPRYRALTPKEIEAFLAQP